MVNDRLIKGTNLKGHPLAQQGEQHGVYSRTPPIMCIRADNGGRLEAADGIKTFHAGDWICTDIPPSYAWIIDQQAFAASNYTMVGTLNDADAIVFPIAEADYEIEHSRYTGRAEPAKQGPDTVLEVQTAGEKIDLGPDPLASEHMVGSPTPPPTKAGLPQQNPQKAVTRPSRPKK